MWILCDILRNPNCLEECWNLFKTLILKIWYFKAAFFQRQRVHIKGAAIHLPKIFIVKLVQY